jgi:hypothetical protein
MHNGIGQEAGEQLIEKQHIGAIPDRHFDPKAPRRVKYVCSILQIRRFEEGFGLGAASHRAAQVIIDNHHLVPPGGKMHCRRPTKVTVTPKDHHTHATPLFPLTYQHTARSACMLTYVCLISSAALFGPGSEGLDFAAVGACPPVMIACLLGGLSTEVFFGKLENVNAP